MSQTINCKLFSPRLHMTVADAPTFPVRLTTTQDAITLQGFQYALSTQEAFGNLSTGNTNLSGTYHFFLMTEEGQFIPSGDSTYGVQDNWNKYLRYHSDITYIGNAVLSDGGYTFTFACVLIQDGVGGYIIRITPLNYGSMFQIDLQANSGTYGLILDIKHRQ